MLQVDYAQHKRKLNEQRDMSKSVSSKSLIGFGHNETYPVCYGGVVYLLQNLCG